MRLERLIHVKKLLFIRAILKMNDDTSIKKIFIARYELYINDRQECSKNKYLSPVYDILNIANMFGILDCIGDIIHKHYLKQCVGNLII